MRETTCINGKGNTRSNEKRSYWGPGVIYNGRGSCWNAVEPSTADCCAERMPRGPMSHTCLHTSQTSPYLLTKRKKKRRDLGGSEGFQGVPILPSNGVASQYTFYSASSCHISCTSWLSWWRDLYFSGSRLMALAMPWARSWASRRVMPVKLGGSRLAISARARRSLAVGAWRVWLRVTCLSYLVWRVADGRLRRCYRMTF